MRTCVSVLCLTALAALAAAGTARAKGVHALATPEGGWEISPPAQCVRKVALDEDWTEYRRLSLTVRVDRAPAQPLSIVVGLVAWDGWWYQTAEPVTITGTQARRVELDLNQLSGHWVPRGHLREWDGYARQRARSVQIAVFSSEPYRGRLHIDDITLEPAAAEPEPDLFVYDANVVTGRPTAGEPATVDFRLSRSYQNPFERDLVTVSLEGPDGRTTSPAYFYQAYREANGERLKPVGAASWRARLVPPGPGTYRWVVRAVAGDETIELPAGRIVVDAPRDHPADVVGPSPPDLAEWQHFVLTRRVRPNEPVFSLDTEGESGWKLTDHTRLGDRAEAWWVPLEWTAAWGGYQGLGRYNLEAAWRFDRLLAKAEAAGFALPLALNSEEPFHLAFTEHEQELGWGRTFNWFSNPLRSGDDGRPSDRLDVPSEYFLNKPIELASGDRRTVLDLFDQKASYIAARWGHSPAVSQFELWMAMPANRAEQWHREAGRLLARLPLGDKEVVSRHPQAAEFGERRRVTDFERTLGDWRVAEDLSPLTRMQRGSVASRGSRSLRMDGWFPGVAAIKSQVSESWHGYAQLAFDVYVPPDAPNHMRASVFLRERDWWWYETTPEAMLRPGDWTKVIVDISPESQIWEPREHNREWDGYVAQRIRKLGIRIFGMPQEGEEGEFDDYRGRVYIDNIELWPDPRSPRPIRLTELETNADEVGQFEKFELSFKLTRVFENPFDPAEADIWGHFTGPEGQSIRVPAFFALGYERALVDGAEKLTAAGPSWWKVRFATAVPGTWTCYLEVNGETLREDAPITFEVKPSDARGYVRVSEKDRHYFEHCTGEFFYPIGHNLRSPSDERHPYEYEFELPENKGTFIYDEYFRAMEQAGKNAARIWMCSWWCGLEWNKEWPGFAGIGRYNMENAWRLDYLVEQAGRRGIYIMLDTMNHGQFSTNVDAEWEHNPYNRENGGFLAQARDFFTDERARQKYRNRMRYTIARWGYSPHIMSWSLSTEIEFIDGYGEGRQLDQWHAEMARFVKETDAFNHIVTSHVGRSWERRIWNQTELEFVQSNAYSAHGPLGQAGAVEAMRRAYHNLLGGFNRPVLIAEYGGHWARNTPQILDAELHTGIWAMAMVPYAGNTGFWWWPHIHFTDKYQHYRAIANYMVGEDRRGRNLVQSDLTVQSPGNVLQAIGLQNDSSVNAYVYHRRLVRTLEGIPAVSGGTLVVPGLQNGVYRVEFWDTYEGEVTDTRRVQIDGNTLRLDLPEVRNDVALKINLEDSDNRSPQPE